MIGGRVTAAAIIGRAAAVVTVAAVVTIVIVAVAAVLGGRNRDSRTDDACEGCCSRGTAIAAVNALRACGANVVGCIVVND